MCKKHHRNEGDHDSEHQARRRVKNAVQSWRTHGNAFHYTVILEQRKRDLISQNPVVAEEFKRLHVTKQELESWEKAFNSLKPAVVA